MPLSLQELSELVSAGVVTPDTANAIRRHQNEQHANRAAAAASVPRSEPAARPRVIASPPLDSQQAPPPRFDLSHTAYYGGALLVMGALGWYMTKALASGNGWSIATLAICYGVGFLYGGEYLWQRPALRQPGGLLFVLAVWMVPLALFGVLRGTGIWGDSYDEYFSRIKGHWVLLEIATATAGILLIRHRQFPFLTFPVAFAAWFLTMDLAALALGDAFGVGGRRIITALVALLMMAGARYLEEQELKPFAFWFYLFGLIGLWGVVGMDGPSSPMWPVLALACMATSIALSRRTFMVFGGVAMHVWLGYLSFEVFADSGLFPLAMSGLGVLIIWSGIWYARNGHRLAEMLDVR